VEFTNAYPWEWQPADAEAFIAQLRSSNGRKPIAMSTGRGYETTLTLFMEYLTDRRYGWPEVCLERFGDIPQQIFHEDNRVAHVVEYEGRPGRRPLTYDEVQALFDAADGRAEATRSRGRKGALTAMRDAACSRMSMRLGSAGTKLADLRPPPDRRGERATAPALRAGEAARRRRPHPPA
jgi:hypothetical protein